MSDQIKFEEGDLKIVVDKFRSKGRDITKDNDMARITFKGPIYQLKPMISVLERFMDVEPKYIDPNRGYDNKVWYRLYVLPDIMLNNILQGRGIFEKWVMSGDWIRDMDPKDAEPTNPNYVEVNRFVVIETDRIIKKIKIRTHGNIILTLAESNGIGAEFLGDDYVNETER